MVQATEDLFKQCLGEHYNFIIRPQWSYNYGIVGEFVEHFRGAIQSLEWIPLDEWESIAGCDPDTRIYCISFPRLERLNCLSHAAWGHEVGHVIAHEWLAERFEPLWKKEEPRIREEITKSVEKSSEVVSSLFRKTYMEEIVASQCDRTMEVARQGLEELLCDAVGVYLLGPAAVASLVEFSAGLGLDESPLDFGYYPAWRYRLRLVADACKEDLEGKHANAEAGKYPGPTLAPFIDWLNDALAVVDDTRDRAVLRRHVTTREAYALIEKNWGRISKDVMDRLAASPVKPYELSRRVPIIEALVGRLEVDVPPNEPCSFGPPASYQDILTAGWVFKIKSMRDDGKWANADSYEKLFRLVLKAIESAFVQERYGPILANESEEE
ncbi:MAG TPA: hypothetical protein VMZ31_07025 [Phycisphaerae bacterium]|nr:hypothetical protein [Phycisphaerae bacterium]